MRVGGGEEEGGHLWLLLFLPLTRLLEVELEINTLVIGHRLHAEVVGAAVLGRAGALRAVHALVLVLQPPLVVLGELINKQS